MLDLAYNLKSDCPIPWNAIQKSNLHSDYPLPIDDDELQNPHGYVIRRYLETVWLPESISSLAHLITSLQRVQPFSLLTVDDPTAIHPLHEYLDLLLLTVKTCSEKYRTELPQIIANGGGAGEQEEAMMWFAWNYGLEPEDINSGSISSQLKDKDKNKEDIWKAKWLEKLERRETMIQILLYLLKLSLSGPCPLPSYASPSSTTPTPDQTQTSPSKKRKRSHRDQEQKKSPIEVLEEQLELYMDKLSTWQLMDSINPPHARDLAFRDIAILIDLNAKGKVKDERHWAVAFCEEIVEFFFKDRLPTYCALLRSKLIPESTTEDDSDNDLPSPTSPTNSRGLKRANSTVSGKSLSRTRSNSRAPTIDSETTLTRGSKAPSRSRSLSISLAEDEDKQRRALVGPKRMLSREISMSRTFKEKTKQKKSEAHELISQPAPQKRSNVSLPQKTNLGKTIVEDTPARRPSASYLEVISRREVPIPTSIPLLLPDSDDNIIVEDTPIRPRKFQQVQAQASDRNQSQSQTSKNRSFSELEWDDDDDDEFTDSFGSPDILMLGSNEQGSFILDTPTKPRK